MPCWGCLAFFADSKPSPCGSLSPPTISFLELVFGKAPLRPIMEEPKMCKLPKLNSLDDEEIRLRQLDRLIQAGITEADTLIKQTEKTCNQGVELSKSQFLQRLKGGV